MATFPKATFFFDGPESGHSESHYHTNTTISLVELVKAARLVADKRKNLLGDNATLTVIRVSHDDTFNDSLLDEYYGTTSDQFAGSCDVYYSSQLVRGESGSGLYRKSIYLGLYPDNIATEALAPPTKGSWRVNFKDYSQALLATWGWKTNSKDLGVAPVLDVVNALYVDPNKATFLIPGHNMTIGQSINVRGIKAKSGTAPKGNFKVTSVPDDSLVGIACDEPFTYASGGKIRKNIPVVVPYESLILRGPHKRARGNRGGYGHAVGRRPRK